ERAARAALKTLPESPGRNTWVRVKPQSGTTLGAQKGAGGSGAPLLAVGAYGRGRTAAPAPPPSAGLAPAVTPPRGPGRPHPRLLRSGLAGGPAAGARGFFGVPDKRFYRPGETVAVSGQTFDESANRTGRYRVVAMLEPKSLTGPELLPRPVKWPAGRPRQPG